MQVPIYQNNTPNPQSEQAFARPGENVRPTFDYERAMEKATQPLNRGIGLSVKFAEKAEAQQVKAEADEALNGLDQELRELQWNPESGYYSMKGKTAVEGYDPTREAMNKAYQARLDKIQNPLAKQAFSSVALERINSYDQSMQRYRLKENAAYKAEVSDTRAKSLIDDFAFAGFGPDSDRTLASLMDEVDYQGKIGGKSPEWIARQKDNYSALAYASAYQQMSVEDPYGALKHYQRVGSAKMSPDVSRKTYALLRERVWPQLQETVDAMGGPEAIGLTQGPAARAAGKADVRVSGAQAGLGTPPSVPDKVLNTIGYKFCNPLNIKVFGNNWSGMVGQDARGHAIFETPQDGICAAAKILKTYSSKYGINTVDGIVDRFCAASDGVTRAYISNVCKAMGVNPGDALDVKDPQVMTKLISAMMRQEIGAVAYSQETITAGVHKALGIVGVAEQSTDKPRLTSKDVAFNPNVQTGDPVIDALPLPDKIKLFRASRQRRGQQTQQAKVELKRSVDNVLSRASNTGDVSELPDVADFISVYGQDEGVRMHAEVEKQAQLNAVMFTMPAMSAAEMDATSRALMPQKDDPEYAARMEQKATWDKAAEKVKAERAKDPMLMLIHSVPDTGLTHITDWNRSPALLAEEIKKRAQMSSAASGFFGLPQENARLLTNDEAKSLTETLDKLTAEQAEPLIVMITQMAQSQGGEDAGRALLAQFSDKKGFTRYGAAMLLATDDNAVNSGYVRQYLNGTNPDVIKSVDASSKIDMAELAEKLNGVFPTRSDLAGAYEIVKGMYYGRKFTNAGRSEVKNIVEDVYGETEDYNGGKVFKPRGSNSSMKALVRSFTKLNEKSKAGVHFRGQRMTLGEFTQVLPSLSLQSLGDGRYLVKDGTTYVSKPDGSNLILDFNSAVADAEKVLASAAERYEAYTYNNFSDEGE